MHPTVLQVTQRIAQRSAAPRRAYLERVERLASRPRGSDRLGCANVAHAFAALPGDQRLRVVAERAPNLAIVTAYNDMLSAHQPYERFPAWIRDEARALGATAQVAGGVPAMCDGVTQGQPGMELSLFSRDTIAMGTAVALSHDVFDGALLLGVCDKIVPGLLIGALHFGHLPCVFVPAGPMTIGPVEHREVEGARAARARAGRPRRAAAGRAGGLSRRRAPAPSTAPPTATRCCSRRWACTCRAPPSCTRNTAMREALTRAAVRTLLAIVPGQRRLPIGRLVDERVIVNAMVALLATGGSTNHLIHWVAVARAAGMTIDWTDFAELSSVVPLLARVYPNGSADVNQFQAAGGTGFVLRELARGGLLHADVLTVDTRGIAAYGRVPELRARALAMARPACRERRHDDPARRRRSVLGHRRPARAAPATSAAR